VKILLRKRGATEEQINDIINTIEEDFQGIRRILCSKIKRAMNFIIDLGAAFLLFFILTFLTIKAPSIFALINIILTFSFVYIIPEVRYGQTLGKYITKTMVVNAEGKIPNLPTILLRTLSRLLIHYCLISPLLRERAKHDIFSNTFVVCKKRWKEMFDKDPYSAEFSKNF